MNYYPWTNIPLHVFTTIECDGSKTRSQPYEQRLRLLSTTNREHCSEAQLEIISTLKIRNHINNQEARQVNNDD